MSRYCFPPAGITGLSAFKALQRDVHSMSKGTMREESKDNILAADLQKAKGSENSVISGLESFVHSVQGTLGLTSQSKPESQHAKFDFKKTNFDKIVETSTSYQGIDVTVYKSRETGLKVFIANIDSPIVSLHRFSIVDFRYKGVSHLLQRFETIVAVLMYIPRKLN